MPLVKNSRFLREVRDEIKPVNVYIVEEERMMSWERKFLFWISIAGEIDWKNVERERERGEGE